MYSKEEAFQIKQKFWVAFGQYMALQSSAEGVKVNWLNYKTGVKDLYFRLDVDNRSASVRIEMAQKDPEIRESLYEKFEMFENVLHSYLEEDWIWNKDLYNEQGKIISTIGIKKEGISIFRETDWQEIISFFKTRLLALDQFWTENKEAFSM